MEGVMEVAMGMVGAMDMADMERAMVMGGIVTMVDTEMGI